MPNRKEIRKNFEERVRRDLARHSKVTKARWDDPSVDTGPIRRPLRTATTGDRVLIFLFIFIASVVITGVCYAYIAARAVGDRMAEQRVPLVNLFGNDARIHFAIVCLAGGFAGVVIYAICSAADPYGNVAAEKKAAKRRDKRAKLLREIRAVRQSSPKEYEQAIGRLAEQGHAEQDRK